MSVISPNLGQRVAGMRRSELSTAHKRVLVDIVRRGVEMTSGAIDAEYRKRDLGMAKPRLKRAHVSTRHVLNLLYALRDAGELRGSVVSRGRYGVTTYWSFIDPRERDPNPLGETEEDDFTESDE